VAGAGRSSEFTGDSHSVIGPKEIHLFTNPEGEHRDFVDCVKSRKDPYFPVEIGHRVPRFVIWQHCDQARTQAPLGSES